MSFMRESVASAVVPVGWPPLGEGTCSRARGVTEADLAHYAAKFGNPTLFVGLVEWADRVITE